jgi:hypothetical protein
MYEYGNIPWRHTNKHFEMVSKILKNRVEKHFKIK